MQIDYRFARKRVREWKAKLFLAGLSLILGLLPVTARAQGISVQGQAIVNQPVSVSGIPGGTILQAVPNASISVCSSSGGGIPCSPLVTIYSNAALTTIAPNPLTADANGNFQFFIQPNATGYLYSMTSPGIVGQLYTILQQASTVLNAQLNGSAITGTGSPVTLYTFTVPAGAVSNLKGIRVTAGWSHSAGSANATYALSLNGQTILSYSGATTGAFTLVGTILNTGTTTGTATADSKSFNDATNGANAVALTGLSWASAQTFLLTFSVANPDQITPIQWLVELIQ